MGKSVIKKKIVRKNLMGKTILNNSKGELNISFGLIFSIIAGIFILFMAIFAAVKLRGVEMVAQEGETSTTIGNLMNPLESSFESSKRISLIMPVTTRIYTYCYSNEEFGWQFIQTSQLTSGKWTESELNISTENKYLFSENPAEGRKFYVFSKPFEFPYKVADLIYIISSEDFYCFINAPNEIEDEIDKINQPNLKIEECPEDSTNICFKNNQGNCDIKVSYSELTHSGYVTKNTKKMYFSNDALMYAGIFSNSGNYDCQLKRLIQRTEVLNRIYQEKNIRMMRELQCGTSISSDLAIFGNLLSNYKEAQDIIVLGNYADDLNVKNNYGGCELW